MYSVKAVATGRAPWEPRTTGEGPRETPGTEGRRAEFLSCFWQPPSPRSRRRVPPCPPPSAGEDLPRAGGCCGWPAEKRPRSVRAEVLWEEVRADSGAGLKERGWGRKRGQPRGHQERPAPLLCRAGVQPAPDLAGGEPSAGGPSAQPHNSWASLNGPLQARCPPLAPGSKGAPGGPAERAGLGIWAQQAQVMPWPRTGMAAPARAAPSWIPSCVCVGQGRLKTPPAHLAGSRSTHRLAPEAAGRHGGGSLGEGSPNRSCHGGPGMWGRRGKGSCRSKEGGD